MLECKRWGFAHFSFNFLHFVSTWEYTWWWWTFKKVETVPKLQQSRCNLACTLTGCMTIHVTTLWNLVTITSNDTASPHHVYNPLGLATCYFEDDIYFNHILHLCGRICPRLWTKIWNHDLLNTTQEYEWCTCDIRC